MKIPHLVLAAAIALALPSTVLAQSGPGPDAHQPVPDNQLPRGGMGGHDQGDARDDMHQGDARNGDMRHDEQFREDGRGEGMGPHQDRHHRHCWTKWHHHHRVRSCH